MLDQGIQPMEWSPATPTQLGVKVSPLERKQILGTLKTAGTFHSLKWSNIYSDALFL